MKYKVITKEGMNKMSKLEMMKWSSFRYSQSEKIYTIAEACTILGTSRYMILQLRKQEIIATEKFGNQYLIRGHDLFKNIILTEKLDQDNLNSD